MSRASDPFTPDETTGLAAILDTLIPRSDDGRLPGAGAFVDAIAEGVAPLRRLIAAALTDLDARAAERGAPRFAGLSATERDAVLRAHAEADPSLVPALVFHAYTTYYQQQPVVEALGLEHRSPHPEGYALEPTDPSRLDAMRRRPPLYRTVD